MIVSVDKMILLVSFDCTGGVAVWPNPADLSAIFSDRSILVGEPGNCDGRHPLFLPN